LVFGHILWRRPLCASDNSHLSLSDFILSLPRFKWKWRVQNSGIDGIYIYQGTSQIWIFSPSHAGWFIPLLHPSLGFSIFGIENARLRGDWSGQFLRSTQVLRRMIRNLSKTDLKLLCMVIWFSPSLIRNRRISFSLSQEAHSLPFMSTVDRPFSHVLPNSKSKHTTDTNSPRRIANNLATLQLFQTNDVELMFASKSSLFTKHDLRWRRQIMVQPLIKRFAEFLFLVCAQCRGSVGGNSDMWYNQRSITSRAWGLAAFLWT
jgi:hypothetical protein